MSSDSPVPISKTTLSATDIDESVRLEKIRLIYSNIPTNILSTLIGAALFAYTQSNFIEHSLLINWILFLLAIALVRLGLFIAYQITPNPKKRIWEIAFVSTVLTTSIIWASAIFFLTSEDNIVSQVILAAIMMAVAAGSVSTLSYLKTASVGFLSIISIPLIFWSLSIQNEYSFYLGLVYLVFFLTLLLTSLRFNRYITESIELSYKSINHVTELDAANEQSEYANAAKSIFLSSMSHELRTPMNAIMGFAQIMQIDRGKTLTQEQLHNLKEIMSASEHLLALIDDILDLSHLESGQFSSVPTTININDVIDETIPLVFHLMKRKNINISVQDDIEFLTAYADPLLLRKVLFNLLCNAIKYNIEGGNITITAKKLDTNVDINIIDTGNGIADDDIGDLFKSFHRLDRKNNVNGVGIGLALSKEMLEVMNSKISVTSTIGQGSCFTITLPSTNEK